MKAFQIAEIENFTEKEREAYMESIKYYNDLKNSLDKSFEDGIKENKFEIVKIMFLENEPIEKIIRYTNLTKNEIETFIKEILNT